MKILIDGSHLCYRSRSPFFQDLYYTSQNGKKVYTGVIYSFLRDLLSLAERHQENKITEWAVCWDSLPTYRVEIDKDYKANRRQTEDEKKFHLRLKKQMKELQVLTKSLGINQYKMKGYEADDLLASLAFQSKIPVEIISKDKDMYQCLEKEKVWLYTMEKRITEKWFVNEYGVKPSQWIYIQALTGDTIDNIQGIKGVGIKTAIKMLNCYSGFQGVIDSLGDDDMRATVHKSLKLVTLRKDLKLKPRVGQFDLWELRKVFIQKRLKSMMKKIDNFQTFS